MQIAKQISINGEPSAPTIGAAYNTTTKTYPAEPLPLSTLLKITMTGGTSTVMSDYQWLTSDPIYPNGTYDISVGGYVFTGKSLTFSTSLPGYVILKARYRLNSTGAWGPWGTRSFKFGQGPY